MQSTKAKEVRNKGEGERKGWIYCVPGYMLGTLYKCLISFLQFCQVGVVMPILQMRKLSRDLYVPPSTSSTTFPPVHATELLWAPAVLGSRNNVPAEERHPWIHLYFLPGEGPSLAATGTSPLLMSWKPQGLYMIVTIFPVSPENWSGWFQRCRAQLGRIVERGTGEPI